MLIALMVGLFLAPAANALIIYGGATGQTTDPGGGLPWANVGNTGVFLGNYDSGYWVITANHVGYVSGITLDGTHYSAVGGTNQRVGTTDLLLYRIDVSGGAPSLSNLTISHLSPSIGQAITMVADGSGTMTWGDNTVDGYGNYTLVSEGPTTFGLVTDYDAVAGETQAQGGDSGGALFYEVSTGNWWLSGIISGVDTVSNPDITVSVALGYYYNDIVGIVGSPLTAVPEPATWAALLGAFALIGTLVVRRRRRLPN